MTETTKEKTLPASLADIFKNIIGFDLNTAISVFDREIRQVAEKTAVAINAKLPPRHWLRSGAGERLVAIVASRIESASKNQRAAVRELAEKTSDFIDAVRCYFYGSSNATKLTGQTPAEIQSLFREIKNNFLADAKKTFAEATDKKSAANRLKTEYDGIRKLETIICGGGGSAPNGAESSPPKTDEDKLGRIGENVRGKLTAFRRNFLENLILFNSSLRLKIANLKQARKDEK